MIQQIRTQQAYQQVANINKIRANQQIATYQGRDPYSGDRILKSADGGAVRVKYLSTNEPQSIYATPPSSLGIPGYAIDK